MLLLKMAKPSSSLEFEKPFRITAMKRFRKMKFAMV